MQCVVLVQWEACILYLQLWHAANQLIGQAHIWLGGVVERNELWGQIAIPMKEPGKKESNNYEYYSLFLFTDEKSVRSFGSTLLLWLTNYSLPFFSKHFQYFSRYCSSLPKHG